MPNLILLQHLSVAECRASQQHGIYADFASTDPGCFQLSERVESLLPNLRQDYTHTHSWFSPVYACSCMLHAWQAEILKQVYVQGVRHHACMDGPPEYTHFCDDTSYSTRIFTAELLTHSHHRDCLWLADWLLKLHIAKKKKGLWILL